MPVFRWENQLALQRRFLGREANHNRRRDKRKKSAQWSHSCKLAKYSPARILARENPRKLTEFGPVTNERLHRGFQQFCCFGNDRPSPGWRYALISDLSL